MFVATFAFTIRTFFTGDLPFDSRPESTQAKRGEQLKALLVAKLDGISEGLDRVHPLRVRLSEGSAPRL